MHVGVCGIARNIWESEKGWVVGGEDAPDCVSLTVLLEWVVFSSNQQHQGRPSRKGLGKLALACFIIVIFPQIPCLFILGHHIGQQVVSQLHVYTCVCLCVGGQKCMYKSIYVCQKCLYKSIRVTDMCVYKMCIRVCTCTCVHVHVCTVSHIPTLSTPPPTTTHHAPVSYMAHPHCHNDTMLHMQDS